jgi:hypothetical protein
MCDITRLAKRNTANALHGTRNCIGRDCLPLPPPGYRPRTSASSSPTAYAMYVSNTANSGMTQQRRITPPRGYSNTLCCSGSTDADADVNYEVCGGGPKVPFGCCIYRGRGVRPNKKWSPSQLAPWRMGPAPNRMQRIGNVQPPSTANIPRMARATPIVGTPGFKGQPSNLSSSQYLAEVKQGANYVGPCPTSPNAAEPGCKTVTQTVAVYSGSRLRNCTSAVDCPVVERSENVRFTGTGVQRFSTADMPTVSVCPNPELYESCKC